ncbi:MAG: PilN domain-containing protein, partial [Dehalococcoidales bacterium]|nr:PilN domain-containing protein [Dehalococcoidales bacterium]
FYNTNNPDDPLGTDTTVFISGDIADDAGITELIARETGYRAAFLSSPLKCARQLDPSQYLVNVGLALKELARKDELVVPNINCLPSPYQPRQIPRERLAAIPAGIAAVGLLMLLFFTVQDAAARMEQDEGLLAATKARLEQRQSQKRQLSAEIAAVEKELASVRAQADRYASVLEVMTGRARLMNEDLETTVYNKVASLELYNISHSGSQLSLQGSAASEDEVVQYVRRLQNTGRFKEITITTLRRETGSDNSSTCMNYSINIKLKETAE